MNARTDILTLSFLGPMLLLSGQSLALAPDVVGTLIQTIDTSQWSSPSPDPSGLAYLTPLLGTGNLLISDGEVDEMAIFQGVTLYETTLSGGLQATASTMVYSDEPVGVAFNPTDEHLFISDDNLRMVFEIDPGPDGVLHTDDDLRTSFSTNAFGSNDPEGVAFSPPEGALYIADGLGSEIYKVLPGPDGRFDTAGDNEVTHFDTESLGVEDPEGIEFETDNRLYIVGKPATQMAHVYTAGALIRRVDISEPNPDPIKPAGLAMGPGSLDPNVLSVYVADRGVDNDTNPNENDGKVYEFSVPPLPGGNHAPSVAAGPDQTIVSPADAVLDGVVVDEQTVTTTWSQVSSEPPGGTVTFADPGAVDTTASFSTAGDYVLRLTANAAGRSTSDDVTVTVREPFSAALATIYVSTAGDGTVGGVSFRDEDIIAYAASTGTWSRYFDGSDVGLGGSYVDIDAFDILPPDPSTGLTPILISLTSATTITVNGTPTLVDDSDIVRFIPTSLGRNTAGSYEWYFDGSDVDLDLDDEDIDAIGFAPDGRLLISTTGSPTVTGVSFPKDEDLFAFTPSDLGTETSGTWAMYFDGSDVGLSTNISEDVNGTWIDESTGHIYLTTLGAFSVTGASGGGDDIFRCIPGTIGGTTTCTYDFTWDGIASGLPTGAVVDGIDLAPPPPQQ